MIVFRNLKNSQSVGFKKIFFNPPIFIILTEEFCTYLQYKKQKSRKAKTLVSMQCVLCVYVHWCHLVSVYSWNIMLVKCYYPSFKMESKCLKDAEEHE